MILCIAAESGVGNAACGGGAIDLIASPTMAKTHTYYFTSQSGGAYRDGITITDGGSPSVWSGSFVVCANGAPVGGFTTMIRGRRFIDIATTQSNNPGWSFTFLLDPEALQRRLYSDYPEGLNFVELNAGILSKHPPNISEGGHARTAIFKNPKVIAKSVSGCGL